ncbi:15788_t:CDS:2, partial [Cetraspora pellucida]
MTQPNTPPHTVDKNGMIPTLPLKDRENNESRDTLTTSNQFPEFRLAVNANAEESVNKIAKAWRNHRLRREKLGRVISSESRDKLHSEKFVCLHLPGHCDSCPVWLKWEELLNTIESQLHRKDSKIASKLHVIERIGKGTRNVNGHMWLLLDTEHWLEICDSKHRYGANLKIYHDYWLKTPTKENFFDWLDKGGGKNLDLNVRPRNQLENETVKYCSKTERLEYEVIFKDGLLIYKKSGKPVNTHESEDSTPSFPANIKRSDGDEGENNQSSLHRRVSEGKNEKWIYVTDCNGNFFVSRKVKGHFHHSSFLSGGAIAAAGGIRVRNGKLIELNPKSGHYKPTQCHFDSLIDRLKKEGVDLNGTKLVHPSDIMEKQLYTKYIKRMPDLQKVHEEILQNNNQDVGDLDNQITKLSTTFRKNMKFFSHEMKESFKELFQKNINSQDDKERINNNEEVQALNTRNGDSHKNDNITNGLPKNKTDRSIVEDDSRENQKRKSLGFFHEIRRSFSSSISSLSSFFLGDDNKTENDSSTENSRKSLRSNEDYQQQKSRFMDFKF